MIATRPRPGIRVNPARSIACGLIAAWPLNEASGLVANDANGIADGTMTGGTLANAGATFTGGTTARITLPAAASIAGLNAASFACQWRPTGTPSSNSGLFYESTASAGFSRFAVFQTTTNTILALCRDTNTGSSFSFTSSALTVGQTYSIALTVDTVSDVLALYINGALAGTNTTAKGPLASGTPGDPIALGQFSSSGVSTSVHGIISASALWSRALTSDEARALHADPWALYRRSNVSRFALQSVAFRPWFATGCNRLAA